MPSTQASRSGDNIAAESPSRKPGRTESTSMIVGRTGRA